MSTTVYTIIRAVKITSAATGADMADVTTAIMMLLYELAVTKAAISQKTPSEEFAQFIQIMEESFGEYLKDHAGKIAKLNAMGDILMGRNAP